MLTRHQYARALTDQFVKRTGQYLIGKPSCSPRVLDGLAIEHAYAFTLKADVRRARACKAYTTIAGQLVLHPDDPRPYYDVRFEFTEFDHIICHMMKRIYGSDWRNPARRAQLPLILVAIDFAGSRYCLKAPPINELADFHLHGTIVFPSTHIERAREVLPTLMKDISAKHTLLFDRHLIEPIDPALAKKLGKHESALANWVEYSLKGAAHLAMGDVWPDELYHVYPSPNGETYNYPRPPVGSPDRRVPFEKSPAKRLLAPTLRLRQQ